MLRSYGESASKKTIDLSINSDLLRQTKVLDINLSAALEEPLKRMVENLQAQRWLEENRASISSYNETVAKEGVFSDCMRSF